MKGRPLTANSAPAEQIRIGVYPGPTGRIIVAPLHWGIKHGYFAEAGVDVVICEPDDHPWYAAGRGDIDCGLSFIDYCTWPQLRSKITAVAVHEQFYPGAGMTCLLGRTELFDSGRLTADPASAKGLRIGLLPGRGDDYLVFRGVLGQAGLSLADVTRVPVPHGGAARRQWLTDGSVDLIIGRRPASIAHEVESGRVQVWKRGDEIYPGLQARYLVANTAFLGRSRPLLLRFLGAYLRGVGAVLGCYQQAKAGDASGITEIAGLTGEPADRLLSVKPVGYHPTGAIDMELLRGDVEELKSAELFPAGMSADDVVDLGCIADAAGLASQERSGR
jgi:ABC-type nitrate/sulfonate/bicarbonate transport system substrate-binding protein